MLGVFLFYPQSSVHVCQILNECVFEVSSHVAGLTGTACATGDKLTCHKSVMGDLAGQFRITA